MSGLEDVSHPIDEIVRLDPQEAGVAHILLRRVSMWVQVREGCMEIVNVKVWMSRVGEDSWWHVCPLPAYCVM